MNAPLPPQNLEAEEHVLGAMMLSPTAIDRILDTGLREDDFARGTHGRIYGVALQLYADGTTVDAITVADRLAANGHLDEVGGKERIREIATLVPAVTNVGHHARIVVEQAVVRRLALAGAEIHSRAMGPVEDVGQLQADAEQMVFDVGIRRRTEGTVTLRTALSEAYALAEQAHQDGRTITGLATGFGHLDSLTSGLHPGNLIVVAARPSIGKTAFATSVALTTVRREEPVAFFTLEMSDVELANRIICAEAQVEYQRFRAGNIEADAWKRIAAISSALRDLPLLIEPDVSVTAVSLRARARRLKLRHPNLALVVVDYLQLMTSGMRADSRTQEVSQISRALKMLASELAVPVIAVSQLSRQVESRHDRRPELRDLRESGQIEADADLVLMLYRDEVYNAEDAEELGTDGVCEVIIAKQRNGPTSTVRLAFLKKYAKFANLAP